MSAPKPVIVALQRAVPNLGKLWAWRKGDGGVSMSDTREKLDLPFLVLSDDRVVARFSSREGARTFLLESYSVRAFGGELFEILESVEQFKARVTVEPVS